jgi:hypothetical protein
MEIIFTEFIFAYSLAECHKKVATIIFYFARAVSHAAVRTGGLCFFLVSALPAPCDKPINRFNLCTVPEKLTTLQAGTQKVRGKKRISGRIRKLYSQSDFRVKN